MDSVTAEYRECSSLKLQQERGKQNPWSAEVCDEGPCHYIEGEAEAPGDIHLPKVT